MKKSLSIVLTLCMLFSLGAVFSSCTLIDSVIGCDFSTEWSIDETSHWHVCTHSYCEEIADKAEHTWDDGSITTKATQEADGVKTYTCTACGTTKTEAVVFTGMTKAEWDEAFAAANFTNFAYDETSSMSASGVTVETQMTFKFTKNRAMLKTTVAEQSDEEYVSDKEEVEEGRESVIEAIKSLVAYDSYAYDAETKTYKATKQVYVETWDLWTKDISVTFEDGKLVQIKYTGSLKEDNLTFALDSTVTITYGSIVINLPNTYGSIKN